MCVHCSKSWQAYYDILKIKYPKYRSKNTAERTYFNKFIPINYCLSFTLLNKTDILMLGDLLLRGAFRGIPIKIYQIMLLCLFLGKLSEVLHDSTMECNPHLQGFIVQFKILSAMHIWENPSKMENLGLSSSWLFKYHEPDYQFLISNAPCKPECPHSIWWWSGSHTPKFPEPPRIKTENPSIIDI